MKTTHPTLRVSNLTYVRVMSALIDETASLSPEDAIALISAIRAYLTSEVALPLGGKHDDILCRYRDLIDRAALRSSRARAAALRRKNQTADPTPTAPISPMGQISPISPISPISQNTPASSKPARPRIKIKHATSRKSRAMRNTKMPKL